MDECDRCSSVDRVKAVLVSKKVVRLCWDCSDHMAEVMEELAIFNG